MQSHPYHNPEEVIKALEGTQIASMGFSKGNFHLVFDNRQDIFNVSFKQSIDWDFTPFRKQNIVSKINFYKMDEIVPVPLLKLYPLIRKYKGKQIVTAHLESKIGMSGVVVFKQIHYDIQRRMKDTTFPVNLN